MKKKITSKLVLFFSVVLSIAGLFLVLLELYNFRKGFIKQYNKNTGAYLEVLMANGAYAAKQSGIAYTDGVIRTIESEFPTSAKTFCMVGENNKILFLRDKTKTEELFDTTVEEYIGYDDGAYRTVPKIVSESQYLEDGQRFWVTRADSMTDTGIVTIAICTQEAYLLSTADFKVLQQHVVLYFGLLTAAFITSVVVLRHRVKEKEKRENELSGKLTESRTIIEQLVKKLESRENSETVSGEGCYYPRSIVERVLAELTREQRRKSRKVMIHLENSDAVVLVRMSVLLERMLNGTGLFCLWTETEFQVIMLNAEPENVNNFAKQLVLQYRIMFQKEIEGVHITIDRL